ncbi:membrane protein [Blastocystis sp. ATCC 50177/Nand II]|uniref:Membrane protein n=1 Tax=Blastocystis sp. subtype 1 (strain ATCC 50177 / NandII) TaxID=478820 RepID=A0A196SFH8_BLAHN|nr:membrane protein [Blastocystis sp. ATCC 50177/Nand II]
MSDSKKPGDISKLVDIDFILDDLNNGGDGQEDDHEVKQPVPLSTGLPRKRRADMVKGKEPKRKRFCWDDNLHYKFLENIFLFGIQNISAQKVFDVVKLSLDGVSYEFIDSYLQMLRANVSTILQDFAASYRQAMAFQSSYSIDGGASRFSVYPFPPLPTDITSPLVQGPSKSDLELFPPGDLALPPFTSNPLLTPSSPTADQPSLYLFQQSQLPHDFPVSSDPALPSSLSSQLNPPLTNPMSSQLNPPLGNPMSSQLNPPLTNPMSSQLSSQLNPPLNNQLNPPLNNQLNSQLSSQVNPLSTRLSSQLNPPPASPLNTQLSSRLSAQLGLTPNTEGLLPLEDGPPLLDSQMDSQIALHQEVLFQNDFVLKRTNGEQNPAEEDAALPLNLDGVQPLPFSAGDEDFSINALLSGPTNDYLRNANMLLDNNNATQDNPQPVDNPNIFDFL